MNLARLLVLVGEGVLAHEVLAQLVVGDDHDGERHTRHPVQHAQRAGAEGDADARQVAQEGRQDGLEDEAKVHGRVSHALVVEGVHTRLADDQIGPLHDDDGDEVGALGVVESLLLAHAARHIDGAAVVRVGGGEVAVAVGHEEGLARVGVVVIDDGAHISGHVRRAVLEDHAAVVHRGPHAHRLVGEVQDVVGGPVGDAWDV
mmetsp:Transcript_10396/g.33016  ORF Transcript_10396/g.33016 Transcript_10396/m.33016 type:complete len:203 (-) Transcript_10396:3284-3892(-)